MPQNPKVTALTGTLSGRSAAFVWVCCLAYAGEHETDGFIPFTAERWVYGSADSFRRLCDAGLLVPDRDGYRIPNWAKYQPTKASTQVKKQMARDAANTRWSKHREAE